MRQGQESPLIFRLQYAKIQKDMKKLGSGRPMHTAWFQRERVGESRFHAAKGLLPGAVGLKTVGSAGRHR